MFGINTSKKGNRSLRFRKNIAYGYILMVILGTLLLFSGYTTKNGNDITLIDAFFVSASAFSDTGLSPIVTAEVFNNFGQVILLILIAVGGIGIMTVKVVLLMLIGKKISTSDRMMISTEQNQTTAGGMVKLIKDAVTIIIIFQFLFTVIIGLHMIIVYDYQLAEALWFGFFHSTSAINNAGFDLTGNSLIPFANDYLFQIYIMILIVIGGLGFPVLIDIKKFFIAKRDNTRFRFSLFSKISVVTYVVITLIGFVLVMIVDSNFIFNETGGFKGIFYALFQVVSARNAGFMTVNLTEFSQASQVILAVLMFIGAAPASTGGGIRTTTFALIFLFIKNYISNKKDVEAFNRRIPKETIANAFFVYTLATFLIVVATLLIVGFDRQSELIEAFFEVSSAFGTTGLTLDFTQQMNWISKLIIAIVMVIGQIGITNTLILFAKNQQKGDQIRLPEENITIG